MFLIVDVPGVKHMSTACETGDGAGQKGLGIQRRIAVDT